MSQASHVFARHTASQLPTIASGQGCYLIDTHGKRYLDGSGGAAVSCLGHGHPAVTQAMHRQLDQIAFAHTGFFTSEPAESLASLLAANAPGPINRVQFVSGGSEAVESAIKLARQYFVEIGQPERSALIARRQSYHGNTLGALSAGGNLWRRRAFESLTIPVSHIAPCYPYRDRQPDESLAAYGQRVADELETEILRLGADKVMAFIAEPVVGATLGAAPAVPGYFRRIREICDRYGVLLILDEVMCGMGRTGSLFACEQDSVVPDIICIAKGLGAGYQPIGAMLCTDTIYSAIEQGSGMFMHSHTYMGHPVACSAGLAVVQTLLSDQLVARADQQGARLASLLNEAFADHPHVGDIRGRGLLQAVELVADRDSRATFDPSLAVHKAVRLAAMDLGLICYPMGGTIDGKHGDHVLLAPAFIISDAQLVELTEKLIGAINAATAGIAPRREAARQA